MKPSVLHRRSERREPSLRDLCFAVLLAPLAGCAAGEVPPANDAHGGTDAHVEASTDVVTDVPGGRDVSREAGCLDTACGTACVDTATDVNHCGDCATDCTMLAGIDATAVRCAAGHCVVAGACTAGHGDCDGTAANGCETDLTTATHCGACATACSGATPVCNTAGTVAVCSNGCGATQTLCGTRCVDTGTDPTSCGACDHTCTAVPDATSTCTAGACGFACTTGFHACGGVCAASSDVATCGTSCTPCATDAHGSTGCDGTACTLTCAAGYGASGGACIDVNECAASPAPCGNGACANSAGSYSCSCPAGYTAPATGGTCTDVDECAVMPTRCGAGGAGGGNGAGCTNTPGSYTCTCAAGFMAPTSAGACTSIMTCGDGTQSGVEACDDGNTRDNDGCSHTCTVETGWSCAGVSPTNCNINWSFNATNEGFTAATVSGTGAWHYNTPTTGGWDGAGVASVSDWQLSSPSRIAPGRASAYTTATLTFVHSYSFESTFDGGVVDVSINGGTFTRVATFSAQGYTGAISSTFSSPIAGQQAFSGTSSASVTSIASFNLASGQTFVVRFRGTNDTSVVAANPNWFLDNVAITFP